MAAVGIIAEYDPLHGGHVRLMEEARRRMGGACAVVCVMSGDFVQRGSFAVLRRQARAEAAVRCGADLVLELPLPWALSSAEGFAAGGVALLRATGVVDALAFGSECGDGALLMETAKTLLRPDFSALLRRELTAGDSFAAARQRAAAALGGAAQAECLSHPNDILGVEYCKALLRQGAGLPVLAVRRLGAGHDGGEAAEYPSSSYIRGLLRQGRRQEALEAMAPAMAEIYLREEAAGRAPVFEESSETAVLARLRSMTRADFTRLDEGGEGLGNRLYKASRTAASLESVLAAAKTKRYPMARLRRMVLRAYLGVEECPAHPPYLRLLACGERGRALLSRMRETASLPVVTRPAELRGMPGAALFEQESRGADLYALAYPDRAAALGERLWREPPAILNG